MLDIHARTRLNGATLRLIISDKSAARVGRQMEAVLADVPYEIASLDRLAAATGEPDVHIGFITRNVIVDSGSDTSVPLARFADVALTAFGRVIAPARKFRLRAEARARILDNLARWRDGPAQRPRRPNHLGNRSLT